MPGRYAKLRYGFVAVVLSGCIQFLQPNIPMPGVLGTLESPRVAIQPSATASALPGFASPSPSPSATTAPTASPTPTPLPTVTPVALGDLSRLKKAGVTFSFPHATWLYEGTGRTPQSALEEIACGLSAKHIKIIFYRNWLQDESPNVFKFDYNIAWQIEILKRCGVRSITIETGRKVQHWPECHEPSWTAGLTEQEYLQSNVNFVSLSVESIATESLVSAIQVDNEPFFEFGTCRSISDKGGLLTQEVAAARAADPLGRQIIITESGRADDGTWGKWGKAASFGDVLGISLYSVWHNGRRYIEYDLGEPGEWAARAADIGKPVIISELQAEPWGSVDMRSLAYDESKKSMNPDRLKRHINFALDAGFTDVTFWGAEWWLFMKDNGHPEMWDTAREIFGR